jgi:hypothetical protein
MHHGSPCRDLAIPCADIEGFQAIVQTVAGVLVFRFPGGAFSSGIFRESAAFAF